jgi:hypothetical protein
MVFSGTGSERPDAAVYAAAQGADFEGDKDFGHRGQRERRGTRLTVRQGKARFLSIFGGQETP